MFKIVYSILYAKYQMFMTEDVQGRYLFRILRTWTWPYIST